MQVRWVNKIAAIKEARDENSVEEMYSYWNGNDRRYWLCFYESGHDGPWWTGVESTAKKRPNGRLKISGQFGHSDQCGHFIGYFNHQTVVEAQTPDMAHSDDLWHLSSVAFCKSKNLSPWAFFSLASSLVYLCVDFQIRTNSKQKSNTFYSHSSGCCCRLFYVAH